MNLSLSDEQVFLQEAARGALSRFKTIEAARAALEDPTALPDLWPAAVQAGWPGLLVDDEHGGAGLDVFEAMLVGRGMRPRACPGAAARRAAGHRDPAGRRSPRSSRRVAAGELRPGYPGGPAAERARAPLDGGAGERDDPRRRAPWSAAAGLT